MSTETLTEEKDKSDVLKNRQLIQDKLKSIIHESKQNSEVESLSIRKVAQKIDVASSTLSSYLNGKYAGDNERIDRAVQDFLDRWEDRQRFSDNTISFVKETRNARRVIEMCKLCHTENEFGVITGNAGVGKTRGLKEYAFNTSGVIMIEVDRTFSAKALVQEIHRKANIPPLNSNMHDMSVEIIDKLRDTNRLIIVDEAEHLPVRALDITRSIFDKTSCGLVAAGLPEFLSELKNKKGDYAYIYSRIGYSTRLYTFNKEDTRKIVRTALPDVDEQVADIFYKKSQGNGRVLNKLVDRTIRVANINDQEIDKSCIEKAYQLLEI